MKQQLFLFALLVILGSCHKDKYTERIIPVSTIDTLTLDDRFDVILTQGTTEELKISGHPALVKKVVAKANGSELNLSCDGGAAWLRPRNNRITVHLTVKELKRINVNETCAISCNNALTGNEIGMVMTGKYAEADLKLNCTTFYFWNNFPCSGKVTLSGITQQLKVWNFALMQIEAENLTTTNCIAENNSKGSIRSRVQQSLTYKITGEGNIVVKGNPLNIQSLGDEGDGDLILE